MTETAGNSQAALDDLLRAAAPPQGCWRDEDYLWLTERINRVVELTDGRIEELPMPTSTHQVVLSVLYGLLLRHLEPRGGLVLFAPLRLRLRVGKFREPDLLLLLDQTDPRYQDDYWLGADLVAEVVSPGNPDRDYIDKRSDYAEAGIPEYWIVDPRTETITVLELCANSYVEHGVFGRGDTATSSLLAGFGVDVSALFDRPRPTLV